MASSTLIQLDTIKCEFAIPGLDTPSDATTPSNLAPRWSDTCIDQPALIVKPATEEDVQVAIRVAKVNGLTIVVGGGGHGTFVRVDSKTLYLNMADFKTIKLDKSTGIVEVGGGVTTGQLLEALADEDYYTPLPNSNAVGVVGCILGGGVTPLFGLHGWMADLVQSFRVVTAGGRVVEVSSASTGEDLGLFNAFCGAGHGLGIVTAVKTLVFPIKDLGMTDDKVYMRSLIFNPLDIDTALEAFLEMRPSPSTSPNMLFMRGPPGTPTAGKPAILVGATAFASSEQGDTDAAALLETGRSKTALTTIAVGTPMAQLNDRYGAQDARGGDKAIASCRLNKLDATTLKNAYQQWVAVTDKYPDSQRSIFVAGWSDVTKSVQLGKSESAGRFVAGREREFSVMTIAICSEDETRVVLVDYMDNLMKTFRQGDPESVPRCFPNNLRFGMDLKEMFSGESIKKLGHLKNHWDADGLFWSPYVTE